MMHVSLLLVGASTCINQEVFWPFYPFLDIQFQQTLQTLGLSANAHDRGR